MLWQFPPHNNLKPLCCGNCHNTTVLKRCVVAKLSQRNILKLLCCDSVWGKSGRCVPRYNSVKRSHKHATHVPAPAALSLTLDLYSPCDMGSTKQTAKYKKVRVNRQENRRKSNINLRKLRVIRKTIIINRNIILHYCQSRIAIAYI